MSLREQNKEAKRIKLINSGWDLFISEGYDRTSVEKITAKAKIARGTFYLYFDTKKALFEALLNDLYSPIYEILNQSATDLREGDSTYTLRYLKTAMDLAAVLENRREHFVLHYREAWSAGPAGDLVRRWRLKIEGLVIQIMRDAMDRGLIRQVDPELVALGIVGAAERLIWSWVLGESPIERRQIAQKLADLFWAGLKPSKKPV